MPEGFFVHVRSNVDKDCARLLRAVDPEPVWHEQGNRKVTRLVRFLRRGGEAAEGQPPVSRHGGAGFAGRFTYSVVNGGKVLRYGNASVQARILALGGPIEAKPGRFLTVPIAKEAQNRRARDFPKAFVMRTPEGKLFLGVLEAQHASALQSVGKGKRKRLEIRRRTSTGFKALFALVKRVFIKPHPYGMEWDAADNAALRKSLERRVAKANREKG